MDEGLPIAYQVLDEGIAVYASDGEQVGTVDHVVSAPSEDIFHGIVMSAGGGRRFVAADQVASLHEHGVDLRIDAAAAARFPSRMAARRSGATATRASRAATRRCSSSGRTRACRSARSPRP